MNKFETLYESVINESSLSRLWQHNSNYDCAVITAYRYASECGKDKPYTKKENTARNRSLLLKLRNKKYGVITVKGQYQEGTELVSETSFWVINNNDKNFEKTIEELGREFEQDSVLFIPKNSINNKEKAYFIKTNNCGNNWLTKRKTYFNQVKMGDNKSDFLTYVNGRPFYFTESSNYDGLGHGMIRMMWNGKEKLHWRELL